jgi:hypothetical protein
VERVEAEEDEARAKSGQRPLRRKIRLAELRSIDPSRPLTRYADLDTVGGWNSTATRRDLQRGHINRPSKLDNGKFGRGSRPRSDTRRS